MGFKSTSTRRTSAASAVSSQSVVVNTPSGFAAVGATIKSNTSISLGVTTAGQTSAATTTTVSAGPVIGNVQYLDANNTPYSDDVAVSTAGGNILINGTGFVTGSNVYVNNSLVSNTFISSTQIRAELPSGSVGNVNLMIFTPTNVGVIGFNTIRYSGFPSWTTAAVTFQNNILANVALVATGDSTLTYTLQNGSSLPTGISLNSAGYLTGTATGYTLNTSMSAVIVVTDAEGQATQQTVNITVTTSDSQFPNTTLLLNGETSVTPFHADASANGFGLTLVGDICANKFNPYTTGYYSTAFSGTPDYFLVPSSANLAFAGDYTLECWVYLNSISGTQGVYSSIDNAADTWAGIYIGFSGTSFLATSYISTADTITHQTAVTTGQWYHLAMVRNGSYTKSYLNGVQSAGTTTSTYSLTQSGSSIGTAYPGSSPFNGYISNLRIVKGQALYTANFTPPTAPLTAVSGTQLLTCQSNRHVDNSANAFALTATGTPKISPASPFAANSSYTTYGSMYVPSAVTNYLSLAHTTATTIVSGATDSFIAECWVYFNSATASTAIMDQSGQNAVTFQNWSLNLDSAKKFQIIWGGTGSPGSQIGYISGTTVAVSNTWYHLAYVKTNADWSLFVNGTREATFSGLNTANDGTQNPLRIGSDTFSSQSINGYISDIRVYKGATAGAPYSATSATITIPTAPLTAITNTQLLTCQYNGSSTNSWIRDDGQFNPVITRTGSTSQGSFSPYSQTGWSNYFDSSGSQYFTMPTATATAFGGFNGNYTTIEFWVNQATSSTGNANEVLGTWAAVAANGRFYIEVGNGAASAGATSKVFFQWTTGTGSVDSVTTTAVVPVNNWAHIAIVVNATGSAGSHTVDIYVNGTGQSFTGKNFSSQTSTYDRLRIGGNSSSYFYGYLSNLRVVRSATNTVGYSGSSISVPTSALTVVTGTVLLTCQNNRFVDNSATASTLTPTTSISVQAFSPFSPGAAYDPTLHGGSMYVSNATANYLTVTDSNIWNTSTTTPPFTVEAWIYPIGITGGCILSGMYANSKVPYVLGIGNAAGVTATNNQVWFGYYGGPWSGVLSPGQLTMNQWTHVAGVYDGTNIYLYLNGTRVVTSAATWPAFSATTTAGYIGKRWDGLGGGSNGFNGYISDVRITKGSAVYSGATLTVPTAPLQKTTNTALLLGMANGGVVDKHSTNTLETVGNTQVSTAVKKYNNASMYFDGTGDWMQFPVSQNFNFGSGDLTIEGWINVASIDATYRCIFSVGNPVQVYSRSGTIEVYFNDSDDTLSYMVNGITGPANSITANTWAHFAVVRNGTTWKAYVNGVGGSPVTAGGTIAYSASGAQIGAVLSTYPFSGYIDDLRVTKGFARYTANFTAPTSALLGQ